jgi:hypothetical protein
MSTTVGGLARPLNLPKTSKECSQRVLLFLGTYDFHRTISRNPGGFECSLASFLLGWCLSSQHLALDESKVDMIENWYLCLGAYYRFASLRPFL